MRHDHFGDEETEAQRQFLKLALGQIVSIRVGIFESESEFKVHDISKLYTNFS